jgi:protein SCO1/2
MDLPDRSVNALSRRSLLVGAAACAAAVGALARPAWAHNVAGLVVPPAPPPPVALTMDDGKATDLAHALAGRVSAVQLMFTSCRGLCPIQGALFGTAGKRLGDRIADAQFLSISIDPQTDDPKALRAWLDHMNASARWRAARPEAKQLDPLVDFLRSRSKGPDSHTAQVYFFDRKGQLVMRSVDFPPATEIVRVLEDIDKKG